MRPVATWSFAPWRRGFGTIWYRTDYFLASARASIEYMNRYYGRPVIYTDTLGKRVFGSLTVNADFVVAYDDIHTKYPSTLWAMAKLLTYQSQSQPYIHFDLDILIHKKLPSELFDCDLMVLGYENMVSQIPENQAQIARVYNVPTVGQYHDLPDFMRIENINSINPYNVGLMYMRDMDFNKVYTDAVFDIYNRNRDLFSSAHRLHICVLEQQVLTLLAIKHGLRVKSVLGTIFQGAIEELTNDRLIHFVAFSKRGMYPRSVEYHQEFLDPWINDSVRYVAQELDKINPQKKSDHAIINK